MIPTYYCRETPRPVDSDQIATCTEDDWMQAMNRKYGTDFETRDFVSGPKGMNDDA